MPNKLRNICWNLFFQFKIEASLTIALFPCGHNFDDWCFQFWWWFSFLMMILIFDDASHLDLWFNRFARLQLKANTWLGLWTELKLNTLASIKAEYTLQVLKLNTHKYYPHWQWHSDNIRYALKKIRDYLGIFPKWRTAYLSRFPCCVSLRSSYGKQKIENRKPEQMKTASENSIRKRISDNRKQKLEII